MVTLTRFRLARAAGCAALLLVTPVGFAAAPPAAGPPPPPQTISIDVRGPLALVTVDRPLVLGREYGARSSDEAVVDLALPPGARLVRAEIANTAGAKPAGLRLAAASDASKSYEQVLADSDLRRARRPVDEGADLRLLVAGANLGDAGKAANLRLSLAFVAPLACRAGELVLAFPASLDPEPAPADVKVSVALGGGPAPGVIAIGGAELPARGRGPYATPVATAAPWEVAITPARPPRARAGFLLAASAGGTVVAGLCRGATQALATAEADAAPGRVLFLLDRSRSMGPTGAASAGALARAIALGLPPGTRFSAVLFDREAEALFPVFRAPTHEALAALETAATGGGLRNGTNLMPALRRARELVARDEGAKPTLVVLISDGAFPDDHTAAALAAALEGTPLSRARFASIVLRASDEEHPAPFALAALSALAARAGGLVRELPPVGAVEAAPELVAALAVGGDLVELRAGAGAALSARAVAPGQGALVVGRAALAADGSASAVLRGVLGGRSLELRAAPVAIPGSWAGPGSTAATSAALAKLLAPGHVPAAEVAIAPVTRAESEGGLFPSGAVAALIGPPLPPVASQPSRFGHRDPGGPAWSRPGREVGGLDRDVVHKALSYAYLPRARACYLTRAIKSAADFELRGRLRLELHLERGEMMDAVVARSSLKRPDIEACLREAAFSVEIPRPIRNDAPALAALNLVFRPHTDRGGKPGPEAAALDRTLERILGPRAPVGDPLELLIEDEARPRPDAAP